MDVLRDYLNEDVVVLIFEFFLDGDNYDPFTLDDIKSLSKKITKWDGCAQWASRKGYLEILKYINSLKLYINWTTCVEYASYHGCTKCVEFALFDVLKGRMGEGNYYHCFDKAIEGGNLETVKSLEPEQDELNKPEWEYYMLHAAKYKQLEVVKYFGKMVVDMGMRYADKDWYMRAAKEGGDPSIMEYVETMFDW